MECYKDEEEHSNIIQLDRAEFLDDLKEADFDHEFSVHLCNFCINPIDFLDDLKIASEHFTELSEKQQSCLISHHVIHTFADTLKYYIGYEEIMKCLEIIDELSNLQTKICVQLVEFGTITFLDKLLYSENTEIKNYAIDCLYQFSTDSDECRHAMALTNILMSLSNLSRILIKQKDFSHLSRYVLKTAMFISMDISLPMEAESYLPLINTCLELRDNERFMRYAIAIVGHIAKAIRPNAFLKKDFWRSFIDFWKDGNESQSITRSFTQFILSRSKYEHELKILLDNGLIDIIGTLLSFEDECLNYGVIGILQNIVYVYQDGPDIVFNMGLWDFFMNMLSEGHMKAKEQTQQFFLMLFVNVGDEQKGAIVEERLDILRECVGALQNSNFITAEFCLRALVSMMENGMQECVEAMLEENDLFDTLGEMRDSEIMVIGELARHLCRLLNPEEEKKDEQLG